MTILLTLFASIFIMSPDQLVDLSFSAITSIFITSNFYWLKTLGSYGAESGTIKPLLHTWSLSLEEQFYLLLPLLVVFFRKTKILIISILSIGSFVFSIKATHLDQSFLLLPSSCKARSLALDGISLFVRQSAESKM